MKGADGIFAIGDCTATSYAPTAQVAAQEGAYLARVFKQLARHDALKAELEEARRAPLAVPAAEGETAESEAERAKRLAKLEAQVAKTEKIRPFKYSHQGSLAYVASLCAPVLSCADGVDFLDTLVRIGPLQTCLSSRLETYVAFVTHSGSFRLTAIVPVARYRRCCDCQYTLTLSICPVR